MQPLTKLPPHNACDVGLLPASRVTAFRAFLDGQNVETRDGRGGQFFHVRTTTGWAPIQRAKRDKVATPMCLRAVVDDFLKAPIGKAILSGNSRALFQSVPEFPAGATEVQKVTALVAEAVGMSDVDLAERIAARSRMDSLQPIAREFLGIDPAREFLGIDPAREFLGVDPANGSSHTVETTVRLTAAGDVEVLAMKDALVNLRAVPSEYHGHGGGEGRASEHSHTPLATNPHAHSLVLGPPMSARQSEYLRDLRDDFALRAPLVMAEGESMAAFADRCWSFADLMIKRRPTMTGD